LAHQFSHSIFTVMHEMGHNLGLLHSGEKGNDYGDVSGYMGYGQRDETTPRKCFNGLHSWQLQWYSDRHAEFDASTGAQLVNIAATVDYDLASPQQPVIIKVGEYYLQYNVSHRTNRRSFFAAMFFPSAHYFLTT
jgi:hypothetical protein